MMNSSKLIGRKALFLAVSVLALGASAAAMAGSDSSNLSVSATVIDNCSISTTALAFGNYDAIVANASTELNGTGSVTITCTEGASAAITLGQGSNPTGTSTDAAPERQMSDGGTEVLAYFLYSDSGHSSVWGNDATVDVEATGTGSADAHTVYGQVSSGQATANAGSYSDTVSATVTF